MPETKKQIKARLQAAGLWKEYLTLREQLAREGSTPRQAREQALREIDARPPQPPMPATTERPADASPTPARVPMWMTCGNPRCQRLHVCVCPPDAATDVPHTAL